MDSVAAFYSSVFGVLIDLAVYVFFAVCVMTIANKLRTPNSWLAFIPIANIYLMCKMVDISGWYTLLIFVPFVNIVFAVYLWWKIAESRERSGWLGILMLVPVADLIVPAVLAFSDVHHVPGGMPTPHPGA